MFVKALFAALPLLAALPQANAWGALGHATVAFIAQNLVADYTETWAKALLKIDNSSYLASVASWADAYRYTRAGRFTEPFHFLDAEDTPPSSCSVGYVRDCGLTGCIVSAVQNYTTILQNTTLPDDSRKMALEMLIHFFGDLTQPLHNENAARGGNDYYVNYSGVTTNLHHVWDTSMLEQLVGYYPRLPDLEEAAEKWAANLTQEIVGGIYENETVAWLSGVDLGDPVSSAMAMSADANMLVCSYVLADGADAILGKELNGSYYEGAVPIFSRQIAKGGFRLAAWLNLIANATTGDGDEENSHLIEEEL